jgi:hypothetical protein
MGKGRWAVIEAVAIGIFWAWIATTGSTGPWWSPPIAMLITSILAYIIIVKVSKGRR